MYLTEIYPLSLAVFQEVVSELRSSIQHDVSTTQDLITKLDQVATQPSAADDIRRRLLSAEEGVTTSSLEIVNQGWQLILNAKDVLDAQRLKVQELLTSILGDRWTVFVPYTWLAESKLKQIFSTGPFLNLYPSYLPSHLLSSSACRIQFRCLEQL